MILTHDERETLLDLVLARRFELHGTSWVGPHGARYFISSVARLEQLRVARVDWSASPVTVSAVLDKAYTLLRSERQSA
jgi:hypothetical protein